MSRIGKKEIEIPEKVEVKIAGAKVDAKGPRGLLSCTLHPDVRVKMENKKIMVSVVPDSKGKSNASLWGTSRTMLANLVDGVTKGFTKSLEFNGVGYKVAVQGKKMVLNLGYSHPIEYNLPEGIEAKVDKNIIEIKGNSKELVGFVTDEIRSMRRIEPYKGKGIKYLNEIVVKKAGKTGAKK